MGNLFDVNAVDVCRGSGKKLLEPSQNGSVWTVEAPTPDTNVRTPGTPRRAWAPRARRPRHPRGPGTPATTG